MPFFPRCPVAIVLLLSSVSPLLFRCLLLLLLPLSLHHPLLLAQFCVLNCTNSLRHSLNAIVYSKIHSQEMLTAPLHSLILANPSNTVVQRKSQWICGAIDKFKQCIDECEETKMKMVELASTGHWDILCRTLLVHPKTFSEFVDCQRKHLEQVQRKCRSPTEKLAEGSEERRQTLEEFCSQMSAYTKCYGQTMQKCSQNAAEMYRQLSEGIGRSFARIRQIALGHLRIPEDCQRSIEGASNSSQQRIIVTDEGMDQENMVKKEEEEEDYWMEEVKEAEAEVHGKGMPNVGQRILRPILLLLVSIIVVIVQFSV